MQFKVKILKFSAGRPVSMIHERKAKEMNINLENRILIKKDKKRLISTIDIVSGVVGEDEIAVSDEIVNYLNLKNKDSVHIDIAPQPKSVYFIKQKLKGKELTRKEIKEIVKDISKNALTEAEIAFFISAVYDRDMTLRETEYFIEAMVETGSRLRLRGKIVDKHCIGGVAGNRTTPLVVSICSSAGLIMPKTSSRAITSAAGTADTIEILAKVDFKINEIKKILKKTKACFVWGGTLGLAPVDDKLIKVGRIIKLDPTAQLLASILSKKISVDSKYVLIDIPYGKSAKVSRRRAENLKLKFLHLGKKFDMHIEVVMTDGSQPIGNGVGPVLEMIDILKVLKRDNPPKDLEEKSLMLSAKILEMTGKAEKNKGLELAREILDSGKAFDKFEEIIIAQKGKIKPLRPGKYSQDIKAGRKLKIRELNNKLINDLAREAGCPDDKFAGVYIHKKVNQVLERGDKIFTIYSESSEKLKHSVDFYDRHKKEIITF